MIQSIKRFIQLCLISTSLCIVSLGHSHNNVVVVPLGGDEHGAQSGRFTINPSALQPLSQDQDYYSQGDESLFDDSNRHFYCAGGTGDEFKAPVYLPHGATITRFVLSGRDTSNTARLGAVLGKICMQNDSAIPDYSHVSDVLETGIGYDAGNVSPRDSGISEVVDNDKCHYHVAIDMSSNAGLASCVGADILFYRAQIYWEKD